MERLLEQFLTAVGWRGPGSAAVTNFIQRNHVAAIWRGSLHNYWLSPDGCEYIVPPDYLDSQRLSDLLRVTACALPRDDWSLCCQQRVSPVYQVQMDGFSPCAPVDSPSEALIRFVIQAKKQK